MCFFLDKNSTLQIAENDIRVHKLFFLDEEGLLSIIFQHPYVLEQLLPKVEIKIDDHKWEVHHGYRSYLPDNVSREWGYDIILECIIPAGTTYITNRNGEVVSETLIVTDKAIEDEHKLCSKYSSLLKKARNN